MMTGNQDAFQKAMNLGHSAAWDRSWEKAAAHYRQALEQFPDHPMALTSLGLALYELQDYDGALWCYQRTSQLSPNDPASQEKLARIFERKGRLNEAMQASIQAAELYLKQRDVDKAVDNWMGAIRLQPEHLMARTRLAMIYDRIGKKEEAAAEYLATASILQKSGDIAKAQQVVEYTLQMLPASAEAQQALHLLATNQPLPKPPRPKGGTGPVRMAEVQMLATGEEKGTQQMDPIAEARKQALVELAELLFEQGEDQSTQSARRGLAALSRGTGGLSLENVEQTRILLHVGQVIDSQTKGDDDQAAEELERALGVGLNRPAAFYDLGMLLAQKDTQKAGRYLQKAVRHPDFALASYLLLGQIALREENLAEATNAYLHALCLADLQTVPDAQRDGLRQMYEPIFESYASGKEDEELKKLCLSVVEQIQREDWRDFLSRARQQMPQQTAGAQPMPLAEMLLGVNSGQVVDAMARVRMFAQRGRIHSALEEAYFAIQNAPTYLPLHIQLAELLLQEDRQQEAVEKFLLVTQLYNLRGETPQAIRLLQRVSELAPMDVEVRKRLIDLLLAQGSVDEAVQQYIQLAGIYFNLTDWDLTRQTYLSGLRQAQQSKNSRALSVLILNKVADLDMQRLEYRQALRIYEQLRTLQPDDEATRLNLVELSFRMGQDQAAFAEIDSYTSFLENAGHSDRAAQFLQNLVKDYNQRFELRRRLADVYARGGQMEKAVQLLDALADEMLTAGNQDVALSLLRAIIGINPPNVNDYRIVYQQLGGTGV